MKLRITGQKHCSDEQLLACMDGELEPTSERMVQDHLKNCWECRARAQDIERQVHLVTKTLMETSFLEMDRAARAKAMFLAWRKHTPNPKPVRSRHGVPSLWATALLAGLAAISLFVLLGSFFWRGASPIPGEIMARSRDFESGLAQQSVHEALEIEMEQVKPVQHKQVGEFQVWSEGGSGRFASQWMTADGKLQYALWHPSGDRITSTTPHRHLDNGSYTGKRQRPTSLWNCPARCWICRDSISFCEMVGEPSLATCELGVELLVIC